MNSVLALNKAQTAEAAYSSASPQIYRCRPRISFSRSESNIHRGEADLCRTAPSPGKELNVLRRTETRTPSVIRCPNILDGRPGFRLRSKWGHVSVLQHGGHICALISNKHDGINPMWKPNWKTIDPNKYTSAKHASLYGPAPEGRLLAGIAGHSVSFDYFGPPSPEEIAAGHNTHGEAPVVKWNSQQTSGTKAPTLVYGADLPKAQIHFERRISLDRNNPVVYCEESALNLSTFDRPISWNEHITFGPPFLECGTTLFDMPATRGKVCSKSFSKRMFIRADSEFTWPKVRKTRGGFHNLRTTPNVRFGHYTAHLLDPTLATAFVAVCNPRLRLLVLYLFSRKDFPWVGNWEERRNRISAPWSGREFCRGFEFSSTPFPIPRRETVTRGNLFGEMTYRWLPAKSEEKVRFLILMLDVSADFKGVASVACKDTFVRVRESRSSRQLVVPVEKFI